MIDKVSFLRSNISILLLLVVYLQSSGQQDTVTIYVKSHVSLDDEIGSEYCIKDGAYYFYKIKGGDCSSKVVDSIVSKTIIGSYFYIYDKKGRIVEEGHWDWEVFWGPYRSYFKNGVLQSEGDQGYYDGKQGLWKYYHKDGTVKCSGEYLNGSKIGTWKTYNKNGEVVEEIDYAKPTNE